MGGCCYSKVVSLQVKDRETGKLLDETVPQYLRNVYRAMYQNPIGRQLIKIPLTTSLLRSSTARYGAKMNTRESAQQIQIFVKTYGVNVDEAELPLEEYATFNEFFARRLVLHARPITAPEDDTILISPADCRILTFPSVEITTKIWLKGQDFTIAQLLGPDFSAEASQLVNPAVVIARLAPQDYHRWHLPCRSRVGKVSTIDGTYFSVSPRAVRRVNILCTNKRTVCHFTSPTFGNYFLIAVGAAMVSSILLEEDVMQFGTEHAKGVEHGHFEFGGSTLILLFPNSKVLFDRDLIEHSATPIETYVKMGTRIGRSTTAHEQATMSQHSTTSHTANSATKTSSIASTSTSTSTSSSSSSTNKTSAELVSYALHSAARHEAYLNDVALENQLPELTQSTLTLKLREEEEEGDDDDQEKVDSDKLDDDDKEDESDHLLHSDTTTSSSSHAHEHQQHGYHAADNVPADDAEALQSELEDAEAREVEAMPPLYVNMHLAQQTTNQAMTRRKK